MKIKCEYCDHFIDDTDEKCPHCGAVNNQLKRTADGVPTTIEELLAFCNSKSMNLKQMRFFIGEDYQKARAFGIYKKDNGNFVVYKNKADGTRAVRYEGKDEAYAVNEIYQKLKSEVQQRKANGTGKRTASSSSKSRKKKMSKSAYTMKLITLILVIFFWFIGIASIIYNGVHDSLTRGYYYYNDTYYYHGHDKWYSYDDGWSRKYFVDDELEHNYSKYYQSRDYEYSYNIQDFEDSSYYSTDFSSSWDSSDWDYDYDSWDSWDTDWDSDW